MQEGKERVQPSVRASPHSAERPAESSLVLLNRRHNDYDPSLPVLPDRGHRENDGNRSSWLCQTVNLHPCPLAVQLTPWFGSISPSSVRDPAFTPRLLMIYAHANLTWAVTRGSVNSSEHTSGSPGPISASRSWEFNLHGRAE